MSEEHRSNRRPCPGAARWLAASGITVQAYLENECSICSAHSAATDGRLEVARLNSFVEVNDTFETAEISDEMQVLLTW